MNSTQEIAELMLDSGRNALLALDIKVSIATLGMGTGALIAGVFGMNVSASPRNTISTLMPTIPVDLSTRTTTSRFLHRHRYCLFPRIHRLHLRHEGASAGTASRAFRQRSPITRSSDVLTRMGSDRGFDLSHRRCLER